MKINNKSELDNAIRELENRKILQENLLINEFKATRESLRPINLIKESFHNLANNSDMQGGILKAAAGIGVGILAKKIFPGNSLSPIKKLLGGFFKAAAINSTISNADKIKAYGISIYHNLFKKNPAGMTDE